MSFKGFKFGFNKESSHKRPHSIDRHGYNHSPYPPYIPPSPSNSTGSGQQPHGRLSVTEKVQDFVSAPQPPISDQFLQKLIVLQDYTATNETELTIRRGEKIEVVRRENDVLFIRNERGKQGFVPAKNCAPPVASSSRRTRSNSRSSIPLRPVASSGVDTGSRGSLPMHHSNSAGHVKRYNSPYESDSEGLIIRRISSPNNNIISPLTSGGHESHRTHMEGPSGLLEPKDSLSSSSGVASLSDPYSPALLRAYSQEELLSGGRGGEKTNYSLSQTTMDPNDPHSNISILETQIADIYRKHSSSDDSGTMDMSKDYASTIRNGDFSSDEGSCQQGRGSGVTTPSMRDRPLPSPPKQVLLEDTPPPVPPRNASLDRKSRNTSKTLDRYSSSMTSDDLDPYAQPIDIINNDTHSLKRSKAKGHHHVDIHNEDTGINSPYSEVYRPKSSSHSSGANKRPINLPEDVVGGVNQRRSTSFTRHRSPNSVKSNSSGIERRGSPRAINGDKMGVVKTRPPPLNGDKRGGPMLPEDNMRDSPVLKGGVVKFRKCLWGVFVCNKSFEGCDENEVSVHKGEHVLVFNQEDSNWFWVVKHKTDNSEGFVPAAILTEQGAIDGKQQQQVEESIPNSPPPMTSIPRPSSAHRHRQSTNSHTSNSNSSSHYPSPSLSHRSRINSTGNAHKIHQSNLERVPPASGSSGRIIPMSPSSPPPPYAEKDPITHHSHHHNTTPRPPTISRNRPSYPGRGGGRVSMPHPLYPSLHSNSSVSRSSTHLAMLSSPATPILTPPTVVGGTLV